MTPAELRVLLAWRMVSDPWPAQVDVAVIDAMLNREAAAHGYADWVDAYHLLSAEIPPNWTTEHREVEPMTISNGRLAELRTSWKQQAESIHDCSLAGSMYQSSCEDTAAALGELEHLRTQIAAFHRKVIEECPPAS